MQHIGQNGRRRFAAAAVPEDLENGRVMQPPADHASGHVQRRAGLGFLEETKVMRAHDQSRFGMRREGVRHAHMRRQTRQTFHHPRGIIAHVHMPHLIAFPRIDAAAPDFETV